MALTAASSTQLSCGRDIDQVWDHLDLAPVGHELTCPYCRAARADLQELAQATRQLRDDDANNPDLQPGPAVLDRILDIARSEVRRGRRLPLDRPDVHGTSANTISEQAVTAVVRRAGDRNAQVQIRRCAITTVPPAPTPERPTSEARDPDPAAVAVVLRVSVAHDLAIADATDRLREAVITAITQEVGVHVSGVDISVEDIHDA